MTNSCRRLHHIELETTIACTAGCQKLTAVTAIPLITALERESPRRLFLRNRYGTESESARVPRRDLEDEIPLRTQYLDQGPGM